MHNKKIVLYIFLIILVLTTGSCSSDNPTPQQPNYQAVRYLDLSGVSADIVYQQVASPTYQPLPTNTPNPTTITEEQKHKTNTPIASPTIEETNISINENDPPQCTNRAEAKSLNISDNTAFKPGTLFAKVWLVKNVGTCTWSLEYNLVSIDENEMILERVVSFPQIVEPGESVELHVNLKAPDQPDPYNSQWMLQDDIGNLFGIGENADQPLQVKIVVVPIRKKIQT